MKKRKLQRILLRMKFMLLLAVLSIELQATVYSQIGMLSLKMEQVSIKAVLEEIKNQTGVDFLYDHEDIYDLKPVSLNVKDKPIEEVLKQCLENTHLEFEILNKTVILKRKNQTTEQQKLKIRGVVVDETGTLLPGVTVLLQGTTIGISTDIDGKFELVLPYREKIILEFSFIGMQKKIVEYKGQEVLQIVMSSALQDLEEVVVTGMQVIQKERMTGSAAVITAKELENDGVSSIDQVLEGRIAGLNSMVTTGAPGARAKITIRGENNLSGNSEPLWILDGLPMFGGVPTLKQGEGFDLVGSVMEDGIGNVNPEDIQSITILKDASATAMYGARAANGVIVITTKKGYQGDTYFSYTGSFSLSSAPRIDIDMMNSSQKVDYELGIIERYQTPEATGRVGTVWKDYNKGFISREQYSQKLNQLRNVQTDWFDEIFRPATSQVHTLTARGGNEKLTFYSSLRYEQKEGILRENNYRNAGASVNLEYRAHQMVNISLDLNANARKNQEHASAIDPFQYAVFANPYERPYDEQGKYAADLTFLANNLSTTSASGYKYNTFNILRELKENKKQTTGTDLTATVRLDLKPLKGLRLGANFRYSESYTMGQTENYPGTYTSYINSAFASTEFDGVDLPAEYNDGRFNESSGRSYNWVSRIEAEYSRLWREKHFFSVFLANEAMARKYNNFNYTAPTYNQEYRILGFPQFPNSSNALGYYEKDLSALFYSRDGQDKSVSFISTLSYAFNDKYVANFTLRADGADIIGTNQRYTPLWSVGLRWNLERENFMKRLEFISGLAIKGSYGYTGQIDRSAYPFSTLTMSDKKFDGYLMAKSFTYANPTVRWEKKLDRNIGMELSLFKHRIGMTFDAYFNKVNDVLGPYNLPISSGRNNVTANTSSLQNTGWETTVNIRWVDKRDFKFHTSFNIAMNKNKITKAIGEISDIRELEADPGGVKNLVGHQTGGVYGWKFANVWPLSGAAMMYMSEEAKVEYAKLMDRWAGFTERQREELYRTGIMPDIQQIPDAIAFDEAAFQGLGLGTAASEIRKKSIMYLGSVNPKHVGGFTTFIKYKTLELSTNWSFKTGFIVPVFDDTKSAPGADGSDKASSRTNRTLRALYQWQNTGDRTDIPRYEAIGSYYSYNRLCTSDKYEKGDYLRLQTLTLSYSLPQEIVKKMRMSKVKVSLQGRNLVTFTRYHGIDPATGGAFSYPQARQFVLNLSLGI